MYELQTLDEVIYETYLENVLKATENVAPEICIALIYFLLFVSLLHVILLKIILYCKNYF